MTMRTDIHRPSVINPADYVFVAHDYIGPDNSDNWRFLGAERAAFRAHMERTGGRYSGHEHGGTCHICGATAFYIAKFYHRPTNTYIVTGEDCAENMHMGDPAAFRRFRDRVHNAREAIAGKAKAKAKLEAAGLIAAWTVYEAGSTADKYEESTIIDIVGKLIKYGSISDKQTAFIGRLLARIEGRAAVEAGRAAERAAAADFPVTDERTKVCGRVATVRKEPGPYGTEHKALIVTDAGWKAWGNLPSALRWAEIGTRVEFSAKLKRSDKDIKFGFWSHPTNGRVLVAAGEE